MASIKYILKYINKGSDYASFTILKESHKEVNEIKNFQTGRYINSNEAAWKIFGFQTHDRYPPVQHLDVHLENNERVYFNERNAADIVTNQKPTTLTAFFNLCKEDDFAKTIMYGEVSKYYTYDKQAKKFKKRVQGKIVNAEHNIKKSNNLSRIYTVNPKNRECYYLRLLLNKVQGPTCFNDLKTIDGVLYPNYQEACLKLGLIGDDKEWDYALQESQLFESPFKIRNLFAIILAFCEVSNPEQLWVKYWKSMSEDFNFKLTKFNNNIKPIDEDLIYSLTYKEVDRILFKIIGKKLTDFCIEVPKTNLHFTYEDLSILNEETSYNLIEEKQFVLQHFKTLNNEQSIIYNKICNKISNNEHGIIFIDAPGGTGKTYLLNLILSTIRSEGKVAVAVASSGKKSL